MLFAIGARSEFPVPLKAESAAERADIAVSPCGVSDAIANFELAKRCEYRLVICLYRIEIVGDFCFIRLHVSMFVCNFMSQR